MLLIMIIKYYNDEIINYCPRNCGLVKKNNANNSVKLEKISGDKLDLWEN